VGDASGHGAQAAVLMAMMRVLLHTTAEALTSPGAVLARLGHQIAQTIPDGRFATACYVVLDPASGRIDFSLAGHPPPLILRATGGAPDELPLTGGPPLGLIVEGQFDAGVETLRPGDTLVLYTDGLTESASPSQELFGDVRLKHALRGAEALSLVELRARILARLEAHTSGAGLEDDLTLLLLRRQPVQASR
jgi:sigma-B regulation protein RsbU (phosphoserine phosphatase)